MTDNFFTRAKERAVRHGWVQGEYMAPSGAGCLAGLMGVRNTYVRRLMSPEDQAVASRAHAFTAQRLGDDVEHWNDAPGRTLEEVLALLDELAEAWETAAKQQATYCIGGFIFSGPSHSTTTFPAKLEHNGCTHTTLTVPKEWVEKMELVDA